MGLQQENVVESVESGGEASGRGQDPRRGEVTADSHGRLKLRQAARCGPEEHLDTTQLGHACCHMFCVSHHEHTVSSSFVLIFRDSSKKSRR